MAESLSGQCPTTWEVCWVHWWGGTASHNHVRKRTGLPVQLQFRSSPQRHPDSLGSDMRYHKKKRPRPRMFVVVWQFEIAEEKIVDFEGAYGPDGAWAQLFRSSPEYLGTELLRDAYASGVYL